MSTVEIYTVGGCIVRQTGSVSVDEASGILKIHSPAYQTVARFERGGWTGFVVKDAPELEPSMLPSVLPAPPPSKDDDIPF